MAWSDELRTGIDEIDNQHQVLFECLKRLEQSVTDDERWSALHFAIEELEDFVRIHFAVEEALMRLHHYLPLKF
jgi:hemerythrin